jgi:hypothetical protein
MPFPITHLRVADKVARLLDYSGDNEKTALMLLGCLAPDGVHYRRGLVGASQKDIGATKKNSHLCPKSDEPWGKVTDNDGWITEANNAVKKYLHDPFVIGYAVHVFTDIYTNLTIWKNFCKNHPHEAAKAYKSGYYNEMGKLDLFLYQEPESEGIIRLLSLVKADDSSLKFIPDRVTKEEVNAIRNSILYEGNGIYTTYINRPPADTSANYLVTLTQIKDFIEEAAAFAFGHLSVL